MTVRERLAAIVDALPDGGAVTLPVAQLRAWLALEPPPDAPAPIDPAPDASLTAAEVAELLHVTVRWVYDHQHELGGRRLSHKCLRFSRRTVLAVLAKRR